MVKTVKSRVISSNVLTGIFCPKSRKSPKKRVDSIAIEKSSPAEPKKSAPLKPCRSIGLYAPQMTILYGLVVDLLV